MLAVVLVLPAAAFAMLPEANARSSTGMDGPTVSGTVVDPDTSGRWEIWAAGHNGNKVTTQNVGRIWTDKTVKKAGENEASDFVTTLSAMSSTSNSTVTVTTPLDIVMVLDASGSMDDHMGGIDSPKRIDALKNAANSFIDTIAKQNEGVPSRFFRKLIEAASAPPCSSPPPSCSARPSPPASTCPGTSSCPIRAPRCTSASPSPASGPSCRPGRSLRLSSSA